MLVMTSDVLVTCKSKYATSCLSIALKYLDLILAACLSPVLVQQYPSKCSIIPKSQYKRKQNQDHNSLFMIDSTKKSANTNNSPKKHAKNEPHAKYNRATAFCINNKLNPNYEVCLWAEVSVEY